MNLWVVTSTVLVVVGLFPALWLGSRGDEVRRVVALQLFSVVTVLFCLAVARAMGRASYLIVPLTLAVLSVVGTLVFTRLLGRPS